MNKNIIAVSAGLIVVAVAFGLHALFTQPVQPELGACTMEALMCPDGSYVGRSGPSCEFSSCQNHDSFIGILRQAQGNFSLEMATPVPGQEVVYTMPLQLKVSNVVGQLINQKVKVYGTFSKANILTVDHVEELPAGQNNPDLGDIKMGQTAIVNGVSIAVQNVVSDSRCPVDAQCITAGEASFRVALKSNTDSETTTISTNKSVAFDSYRISIVNVSPSRVVSHAPTSDSYIITFKVEPLK